MSYYIYQFDDSTNKPKVGLIPISNLVLADGSVGLSANWLAGAHQIQVSVDPANANDLTRKSWVDGQLAELIGPFGATNIFSGQANGADPASVGVGARFLVTAAYSTYVVGDVIEQLTLTPTFAEVALTNSDVYVSRSTLVNSTSCTSDSSVINAGEITVWNSSTSKWVTIGSVSSVSSEWLDSCINIQAAPPVSPNNGDRYLITATASGAWTGHEKDIAEWFSDGTYWGFTTPTTGTYTSVDDETDGIYYYTGTAWTKHYYETTTASLGCKKSGVDIQLDYTEGRGLTLTTNSAEVDGTDISGEGLKVGTSAWKTAIDWSTAYNDTKAVKASDLSSTASGKGASIIGVYDSANNLVATTVENALTEVFNETKKYNYILNDNATVDTTGWSTYADAAGASPVDGTGGSPSITFTRNTTTPLYKSADFVITKDAADRQGQGVAYTVGTFYPAHISKVMKVAVNYKASANFSFANKDITLWVYDVTNSTLIQLQPNYFDGSGLFVGEFQTTASGASYRLIFHIGTTNASAWTVNICNVFMGIQDITYANLGDRQYTLTVTGTNWVTSRAVGIPYKTLDGAWRLKFNINGYLSSGTSSFTGTISGVTFKNILSWGGSGIGGQPINASLDVAGATDVADLEKSYVTPNASTFVIETTSTSFVDLMLSGDVELESMPTWAVDTTPVQLGTAETTRAVNARYSAGNAQTINLNGWNIIDFYVKEYDSHNAVTTGVSWKYTCKVTGKYDVFVFLTLNTVAWQIANVTTLSIVKNGGTSIVIDRPVIIANFTDFFIMRGQSTVDLVVGEYFDIRAFYAPTGGGTSTLFASAGYNYMTVVRQSGQVSIAASEKVSAVYTSNSGQSIPNNSETTYLFEDRVSDSHGGYNTSTGGYTVKKSGQLNCVASWKGNSSTGWEINESISLSVYVNSTLICREEWFCFNTDATAKTPGIISTSITGYPVKVGDIIYVKVYQDSDAAIATITAGAYNFISIEIT